MNEIKLLIDGKEYVYDEALELIGKWLGKSNPLGSTC